MRKIGLSNREAVYTNTKFPETMQIFMWFSTVLPKLSFFKKVPLGDIF